MVSFLDSHHARILSTVFPGPGTAHTASTPLATQETGSSRAGQTFGSTYTAGHVHRHTANSAAERQLRHNAAWSVATRYLSLQGAAPVSGGSNGEAPVFLPVGAKRWTREVEEAVAYLVEEQESGGKDLLEWYTMEVRSHFGRFAQGWVRETFEAPILSQRAWDAVERTLKVLEQLQDIYVQPVEDHLVPNLQRHMAGSKKVEALAKRFGTDMHAMFLHTLPRMRFWKCLGFIFYDTGCKLFQISLSKNPVVPKENVELSQTEVKNLHARFVWLLHSLREVGLGGDSTQSTFAVAMDKLITAFVHSSYMKVDWMGGESVVSRLRLWVTGGFAPFVTKVVDILDGTEAASAKTRKGDIFASSTHSAASAFAADGADQRGKISLGSPSEIQQWQEMAIHRLGRTRVDNLFDYVVRWNESIGAVRDIKEYITTPAARSHVVVSFCEQLSRRILHMGASTTQILDVYINTVRVFNELDPKGVLLERVARPLRQYLRERDDTARIIISSLLADVQDDQGNPIEIRDPSISTKIAEEMLQPIVSNTHDYDEELNWNDMNWTPDPMDASPEYKKSKAEDVLSYLLSLYDREEFINELKQILGEHLLRNEDPEYVKDLRLVELFKIRLGDDKLQACEVMLRDMLDSRQMTREIQNELRDAAQPNASKLNAQILSSFFWPELRTDTFVAPKPIQELQAKYEAGFESKKSMRKLHWLPALGRVNVELELEDRTVKETVPTAFATVIYAFNSDDGSEVRKTVEELEGELQMDDGLLHAGLAFWLNKKVLRTISTSDGEPPTYVVVETLDSLDSAAATTATAADPVADAMSNVKTQNDLLAQNAPLYTQFILGMLTNQGSMPSPRILMMLKMVMPGGFPFGQEELDQLLEGMETDGRAVKGAGGVWSVKK